MAETGAVLSLSGGMDSTTLLGYAIDRFGRENVHTVAFDYGQKHRLELEQAEPIARTVGVPFTLIQLPKIFAGAGSTLVDSDKPIEEVVGGYNELSARFGSQPTVVPNRNMNFIAMSVTYALTKGLSHVLLGVHAGDAANFHYPDCRPPFIGAMAAAIDVSTEGKVTLEAPFNFMSKEDIVRFSCQVNVPMHLTQSCYQGKRPACGKCATCLERIAAFQGCGLRDPIEYEIEIDWSHAVTATDGQVVGTAVADYPRYVPTF